MTDGKSMMGDELAAEEDAAPERAETLSAETTDDEEALAPQEEAEDEEAVQADTEGEPETETENDDDAENDGEAEGEAEVVEDEADESEEAESEEAESEEAENETEFDLTEEAEADVDNELEVKGEPEEELEVDAEKPDDTSVEEPPHPDFEIFLDDETLQEWSYVPLLDLMEEPNIVREEYVSHRNAKREKPAPTPMERAKMLWFPAALLVLGILVIGAWNAWHTPLRNTQDALVDKYGMLTTCEVVQDWYDEALKATDGAGNHPLDYGCVRVNSDDAYCIVNDNGDVLYDNYRAADFVTATIPRSVYLLAAAVDPRYAACAVSGVPSSAEEYLEMARKDIAEYADPISLWPPSTGNGAVIFLSAAIPDEQYQQYVEQCKGLAVPYVRIMRVPADEWRTFQDWVAEWPDYYTTYGLVGLNVLHDNPLIYEGDENAFTHLEDMPDLVEEDIEIVPRAAAEE